jgi:hypothetical protein
MVEPGRYNEWVPVGTEHQGVESDVARDSEVV